MRILRDLTIVNILLLMLCFTLNVYASDNNLKLNDYYYDSLVNCKKGTYSEEGVTVNIHGFNNGACVYKIIVPAMDKKLVFSCRYPKPMIQRMANDWLRVESGIITQSDFINKYQANEAEYCQISF